MDTWAPQFQDTPWTAQSPVQSQGFAEKPPNSLESGNGGPPSLGTGAPHSSFCTHRNTGLASASPS